MRQHPLLGFTAGAALGAAVVARQHRERRRAERLAAATLESLLYAIDANDAETGAHLRRVAAYALVLGDAAGLGQHELRALERVALFHDIGKIHGALFDLIHDASGLTPEERRVIAQHPRAGAEVLQPLAAFYPELREGVLAHHEAWDGSGYPRGLRGEQIPLYARIVAIADTFDAITHRRRYRGELSPGTAVERLLAGRGTQFDPELVDLFLLPPVFERVLEERRRATLSRRAPAARDERRDGSVERGVPDVTFRWRSRAGGPLLRGSRRPSRRG